MRHVLVLALVLAVLGPGCVASVAAPLDGASTAAEPGLTCPAPCKQVIAPPTYGTREPNVAVDPTDPEHLLAASMRLDVMAEAAGTFQFTVHESHDAGVTWTTRPYTLPMTDDGTPMTQVYDPVITFLPDGTAILGGVGMAGAYFLLGNAQSDLRIFSARATNGAPPFDPPRTVARGAGAEAYAFIGGGVALRAPEKAAFAVAPDGTLLAAYSVRTQATPIQSPRAEVALALSRDGAATWSPVTMADISEDAFPGPALLTDDAWHVSFVTVDPARLFQLEFACWLAVSTDDGASWDTRALGPCDWLPALAEHDGVLSVVLSVSGDDGSRPTLLRSTDHGATWDDPLVLDAPEAPGSTSPTALALADGTLVVTFFHALAKQQTSFRAVAVQDGVVSSSIVLDGRLTRTPRAYGDYFGLAPVPGGVVAMWVTDANDGKAAVASARLAVG